MERIVRTLLGIVRLETEQCGKNAASNNTEMRYLIDYLLSSSVSADVIFAINSRPSRRLFPLVQFGQLGNVVGNLN